MKPCTKCGELRAVCCDMSGKFVEGVAWTRLYCGECCPYAPHETEELP